MKECCSQRAALLKLTLLHGCFSCIPNCKKHLMDLLRAGKSDMQICLLCAQVSAYWGCMCESFLLACFKFWMQNNIYTNKGSSSLSNFKACVYYFLFFSPNDSLSKAMKNALFYLKSYFCCQDIQIFVIFPPPFHFFKRTNKSG